MDQVIPAQVGRFMRASTPAVYNVVRAMEAHGETHGPTTIGREVGCLPRLLTKLTGADSVFGFGSGYGYSGYWFADSGADVVLTDVDEANLSKAREFFVQGGVINRATYEVGDAHEMIERYDVPFDVVFVDHEKARYPDASEAARDEVAPGGLLVADKAMVSTTFQFGRLLAALEGRDGEEMNRSTAGLAEYRSAVINDPDFESVVLPMEKGVAVSRKRG